MAEKTTRPQMGEMCVVLAVVQQVRTPVYHPTARYFQHRTRIWTAKPRSMLQRSRPMMYIGYRTIFDGKTWWEKEEVGVVFEQTDHHEVWLFVENERRNPVRAFPQDVIRMPDDEG